MGHVDVVIVCKANWTKEKNKYGLRCETFHQSHASVDVITCCGDGQTHYLGTQVEFCDFRLDNLISCCLLMEHIICNVKGQFEVCVSG